ncbi:MAG: hypothetical protein GYA24_05690 [Candidatus Lokiarchaeota archaeon]|nr:hypothetical protein [Candidatus Lokiarchaeota archaeon]
MFDSLKHALELATSWIVDIAQVKTEMLTIEHDSRNHKHVYWKGAIRGEYSHARKAWDFFCPCWHAGQAIKALSMASHVPGIADRDKIIESAKEAANFLIMNQIWDEKDGNHGLILAYEDFGHLVNTSAILESCDGLLHLADVTGNPLYRDRVIGALDFVIKNLYIKGTGLFSDAYDPAKKVIDNFYGTGGRPLLDDAMFLKGWQLTGREDFKHAFIETCDLLIEAEDPPGNWIAFKPASASAGHIHPRHAYWWGMPFIDAYLAFKEQKYLDVAARAADWYLKAVRKDGGMMRDTYVNFNTKSFGHATSGTACAVLFWLRMKAATGTMAYDKAIDTCLKYCMDMQFRFPEDENLLGAILEKVLPPEGSDRSPYHIRDLGTIFFVQAAAAYLSSMKKK